VQEDTQQVVEDNNLSTPTEEPTLTDQTSAEEVEQPEQAATETTEVETQGEPSESPTEPQEQREVKRIPRIERRFDQFTKKLSEVSKQTQPQAAQYLPTEIPKVEEGREYDAQELDQLMNQKAQAISAANTTQLVAQLQANQTVNNYINSVTEDTAELRKNPLLNPEVNGDKAVRLEEKIANLYEKANPIEKNGRLNPDFDPNFRLIDFAKEYLEELESASTDAQVNAQQNLQAAADSAVLPPSGEITGSGEESLEEMKERLAGHKF
jgi:hypothetical protein